MARLSPETKRVFLLAINEANRLGHSQIEPEHLLLGLAEAESEVGHILFTIGLPLERLRLSVSQGKAASTTDSPMYSIATRQLVKLAREMTRGEAVKPKDLLLAITRLPDGKAYAILKASGELDKLVVLLPP